MEGLECNNAEASVVCILAVTISAVEQTQRQTSASNIKCFGGNVFACLVGRQRRQWPVLSAIFGGFIGVLTLELNLKL